MMEQLGRLGAKNLSMGIDAETASVGELTPQQLSLAASTALNRGVEVICLFFCHTSPESSAYIHPQHAIMLHRGMGGVCSPPCALHQQPAQQTHI